MNVRELLIKVMLDSSNAKKGLDSTQKSMDDVSKAATRVEKDAKDAGKALADAGNEGKSAWEGISGFIKGFASVGTALAAGQQYLENTAQIEKFSNLLGLSAEQWQGWAGACKEAGVDAENFGTRMADLGDWMQDLNNNDSGPLKDFAEKFKVSFKDAAGATLPMEDGLLKIVDTIEGMDRYEATSLLTQIGFDDQTIPLLLKGRRGIEDLVRANKEMAIYSKDDLDNAANMRAAWSAISSVFLKVSAVAINMLAPAFSYIKEKAEALFKWVSANGDSVKVVITALAAAFGIMLIPKIKMLAQVFAMLASPMTAVIAIFAAIVLAVDDFITYLQGGESALADFWAMFGTPEEINAALDAVKEFAKTVGETLVSAWDSVKQIVSATLELFKGFFTGNWDACINALNSLADGFSNLGNIIGGVLDWIKQKLMGLLPDWMVSFLGGGGSVPQVAPAGAPSGASASAGALAGASAGAPPTSNVRDAVGSGGFGTKDLGKGSSNVTNNNQKSVTQTFNNNVTVNSQATDAAGVARDIGPALRQNQTAQADAAFGA